MCFVFDLPVSSAKSGRSGKKRKTPEPEREPEPEVSTGPPPPQPGDEEWEFVDQLIEQVRKKMWQLLEFIEHLDHLLA